MLCFHNVFSQTTPQNYTVAFIADQGLSQTSKDVLRLIKKEGASAVVHAGDFDYLNKPQEWEQQIDDILGTNFPYFISVGEDDLGSYFNSGGYQERMENRMRRLGINWDGDLGVKSSFDYQGIFFVQTAPGVQGTGHDTYIRKKLAANNSIWRISTFHKNQTKMELCGFSNVVGWGVYEESRKGGAFTTSGQCHVYARSYLLSSIRNQTIASKSDTLVLTKDLPETSSDEGQSFTVVSGLGGRSIHDQNKSGNWWAKAYSRKQSVVYGALFGVFNYNGNPNLARFYFKNINGKVVDSFFVRSAVAGDFALSA